MADVTVSASGAHASAAATDRIPASKGPFTPGTKGYLTPALIAAYFIGLANNFTAAQTLASTTLGFSGNQSKAAWTTSGAKLLDAPGTLTDTSSSGTVADGRTNVLGGDTIAASSATTFTDYYNAFLSQPVAGSNVTFTNRWALGLSGGLKSTGQSLTGSQTQSLIDLAVVWNTSGLPTAIKLNLTDTASSASSLLMDLRTGGVSQFSVRKDGVVISANSFTVGSNAQVALRDHQIAIGNTSYISFTNAVSGYGTEDLFLYRDASANTFAQRNGASAQEHRWYNTFTDASNYERMSLAWSSNVAIMKPQNAGTGSARLFVPVTGATIVASLPSASTMGAGARSFVTDALTPVFGATVANGGAAKVPVVSDGTNWLVG